MCTPCLGGSAVPGFCLLWQGTQSSGGPHHAALSSAKQQQHCAACQKQPLPEPSVHLPVALPAPWAPVCVGELRRPPPPNLLCQGRPGNRSSAGRTQLSQHCAPPVTESNEQSY